MRHIERASLVKHFAAGGTAASLPAIDAAHCAACDDCTLSVEHAALAAALCGTSDDLRGVIVAEHREARALVAALIEHEPSHRWPLIVRSDERFHTAAAATELLGLCRAEHGCSPLRACDLSETACVSADRLAKARETDLLRATAWKERANTLREVRRYAEAAAALDSADRIASDVGESYVVAVMRYARAVLYIEPDVFRVDDALALLDDATLAALAARHDGMRHRGAIYSRAIAHYRASRYRHALAILAALLEEHGAAMPATERADVLSLASSCHCGTAAYAPALQCAEAAVSLAAVTAGVPRIAFARQLWTRGEARLGIADTDGATADFGAALATFRAAGIRDEVLRLRLAIVHAALTADAGADVLQECEEIARQSLELDAREPDRRRHFTAEALRYVREAARHRALTVGALAEVRDYLGMLSRRPPLRFGPTASAFVM